MLDFIVFLLSSLGITFIVIHSYIFKPFRELMRSKNEKLGKLVSCPMCFGTYAGWFVQFLILFHQRSNFYLEFKDIYYILYGFISSFVCYTVYLLMKYFMNKYD